MTYYTAENTGGRSSANYHPSLWGDHFLSFQPHDMTIESWRNEADSLKEKINEKLIQLKATQGGLREQLELIDAIQRLGIAYHFEDDIDQILKQIFHHQDVDDENQLLVYALKFRLLREHGYNAPSDVFKKFKDRQNRFKDEWDVQELLALYEASYLKVEGEEILEEALEFTRSKLKDMVTQLNPSLAKQVLNALYRPMRKALTRVYAREFMSFYQQHQFHDQLLLKFAKLDFNLMQKQHQQELSIVSKWWKDLKVEVNFPFARDRVVECYFWMLGLLYEPQYCLARKFLTKLISMLSIVDDIYDNYGTHAELELFTEAVQRWEKKASEKLPHYMMICYQAIVELYGEMEMELTHSGTSFALHYAKKAMKNLAKAYHEESKWLLQGRKTLRMEEYMKIASETTGYPLLSVAAFVGMGEIATKQVFDWVMSEPQMLQAASLICRLMDDIVSYQLEREREHIPSAVECYMKQHGVSEKEACDELRRQVEDAWKAMNQDVIVARSAPMAIPMTLLRRILNLARVMDLLYKDGDGYTNSTTTKHYIVSLLVDPIKI